MTKGWQETVINGKIRFITVSCLPRHPPPPRGNPAPWGILATRRASKFHRSVKLASDEMPAILNGKGAPKDPLWMAHQACQRAGW